MFRATYSGNLVAVKQFFHSASQPVPTASANMCCCLDPLLAATGQLSRLCINCVRTDNRVRKRLTTRGCCTARLDEVCAVIVHSTANAGRWRLLTIKTAKDPSSCRCRHSCTGARALSRTPHALQAFSMRKPSRPDGCRKCVGRVPTIRWQRLVATLIDGDGTGAEDAQGPGPAAAQHSR